MGLNPDVAEVIDALAASKANIPEDWTNIPDDANVILQVMEMEFNQKPLSVHLGVNKNLFPPATELEEDEVKLIVEKILDTWRAYNYFADLPKGLPIRIAYEALLSVWDEVVMCCPVGQWHFDFYDLELEQYLEKKPPLSL